MRRFVVLAARRSGVTLLIDCLNSHPRVSCTKEAFDLRNTLRYIQIDAPHSRFRKFWEARPGGRISHVFSRKHLIAEYLNSLLVTEPGVEAIGVRLAYNQALKYPQVIDWALKNDVGIIHLVRENSLKTYLSVMMSLKRRVYHSTKAVENATIHLQPRRVKRRLGQLTCSIDHYRKELAGGRYLEVVYEEFVKDREGAERRLADFLGVEYQPLKSKLVKVTSDSLREVISNYEEVATALQGTQYEKFLQA